MPQTNSKVAFLPFHAINEFMTNEYRLVVIRTALEALPHLPENYRTPLDHFIQKFVQVPGFRDSRKAPAAVKARPLAVAFEKSPELVGAVISAWAESHAPLRQQLFDLLTSRGWEILPTEADRTKLPGFLTKWPKGEDFEILQAAFKEKYPENPAGPDDISLMCVWLAGRLPYEMQETPLAGDQEQEAPAA